MKMTKKSASIVTAAALTVALSQGSFANEQITSLENTLDNSDLSFAFAQSDRPMQVLALSEQEMRETEGAFWQMLVFPAAGAVGGAGAYLWSTPVSQWSLSGTGRAVGAGATAGLWGAIPGGLAARSAYRVAGAFGAASWYNNW